MEELWRHPAPESTNLYKFKDHISKTYSVRFGSESSDESLLQWSLNNLEDFWGEVWKYTGVRASKPYDKVGLDKYN